MAGKDMRWSGASAEVFSSTWMRPMKNGFAVRVFLLILLVFVAGCSKAPPCPTVRLGNVSIVAPVPAGFNATSTAAPQFFEQMMVRTAPTLVLVEFYITDADLRDVRAGYSKRRSKTMDMHTRRDFLSLDYSQYIFDSTASIIRSNAVSDVATWKAAAVEHVMSGGKDSAPLGVVYDKPGGIGTAEMHDHKTADGIDKVTTVSILVRVRRRALFLVCSSSVNNAEDSKNVEYACSDWADSVLSSNAEVKQ